MSVLELVRLMFALAGCPEHHHPGVCARVLSQAIDIAPYVLTAHEEAPGVPLEAFAKRLWREGSYRVWPPQGARGEVGPAQILPGTGVLHCSGLKWRTTINGNLRCGFRVMAWYQERCVNVQAAYRGLCVIPREKRVKWKRKPALAPVEVKGPAMLAEKLR